MAGSGDEAGYFPAGLKAREQDLVNVRRKQAGRPDGDPAGAIGLAFSGGGIRSATLSIGMLQALAEAKALGAIDYLSTVSGGGYAGAFYGGLFQPGPERKQEPPPAPQTVGADGRIRIDEVTRDLANASSPPIRWLRENGRYIAPSGASDVWAAAAVVLRNLIAVHVVLAVTVVTALLIGLALRQFPLALLDGLGLTEEHRHFGNLWLSPWLTIPAFSLLLVCLPTGIAYWLVGESRKTAVRTGWPPALTVGLIFVATGGLATRAFLAFRQAAGSDVSEIIPLAGFGAVALLMLLALAAWVVAGSGGDRSAGRARNLLTGWLRTGLIVGSGALAFALVDGLGESLYRWAAAQGDLPSLFRSVAAAFAAVATAATAAQKFIGPLTSFGKGRIALPLGAIALLAATVVAGAMLCGLSAVAYGLGDLRLESDGELLRYVLGAGVVLTICFGRTLPFLNRSTLADLYGARLTRAYLGASNEARRQPRNQTITRLLHGDQISFSDYAPHTFGGPLHIINATLNETVSGQSQIEQRDRHGMNMAIGPAGVSVGARHHATWNRDRTGLESTQQTAVADQFLVFPPGSAPFAAEPLTVGQWVAVSGAAVSTGLGWRTSIGLSVLTGLLNLRLGRWWESGVDPDLRHRASRGTPTERAGYESTLRKLGRLVASLMPVQAHLLDELLGRFQGPARRAWYLTDGGHFENTGAYELIRRRLPVIIVCDHGADSSANFTDLADLVRKVRTDFGAEIEFLDEGGRAQALGRIPSETRKGVLACLSGLADIGFGGKAPAETADDRHFAALARISYADDEDARGLLLVIKPRVTPALPLDLQEYKLANADFPNQSTGDQFFDERQWESHRKLGLEMGRALFRTQAGFWPSTLVAP
jgi:hypothetical protein